MPSTKSRPSSTSTRTRVASECLRTPDNASRRMNSTRNLLVRRQRRALALAHRQLGIHAGLATEAVHGVLDRHVQVARDSLLRKLVNSSRTSW